MTLKLHHFAAATYTLIAFFLLASWLLLLTPADNAQQQIEAMFSEQYEHRTFFISLTIVTLFTCVLAISFWFKKSSSRPISDILAIISLLLFGIAIWQFELGQAIEYGLGFSLAAWSWYKPNLELSRISF